jgi:hypothetical protein
MKISPTLTTALAVAALIVPAAAAQAEPADMHASTAIAAAQAREQAQTKQDLRSADARDAAQHPRGFSHAVNAPGATAVDSATKPGVVTTAPVAPPSDDGIDWTTVLFGIAGTLIAVGGIALVMNRRHTTPRLGASV